MLHANSTGLVGIQLPSISMLTRSGAAKRTRGWRGKHTPAGGACGIGVPARRVVWQLGRAIGSGPVTTMVRAPDGTCATERGRDFWNQMGQPQPESPRQSGAAAAVSISYTQTPTLPYPGAGGGQFSRILQAYLDRQGEPLAG